MLRYHQFLTEARKDYAIGIVGPQGGVFAKFLDPGKFTVQHTDLWPASRTLSKHFRISHDTLVTDDTPTRDDWFSIMDWCEREGVKIKFYQPTLHATWLKHDINKFDPRQLRETVDAMTFEQYVTESLTAPAQWRWIVQGRSGYIAVFQVQGESYDVLFDTYAGTGDDEWEMSFRLNQFGGVSYSITQTGHQFEVFATVIAVLKDFLARKNPESVYFTAKEGSRQKLYRRFVQLVPRTIPGYIGREKTDYRGEPHYYITRTSKKKPRT